MTDSIALNAEAAKLVSQFNQTRRQRFILMVRLRLIVQHAARKPDKPAGTALGNESAGMSGAPSGGRWAILAGVY